MRNKRSVAFASVLFFLFVLGALCLSAPLLSKRTYLDVRLKKMHAEPSEKADVVFEFPVDIRVLQMTDDKNWFKISLEFDLLFLGHYKHTGWVHAPLGDILEKERREAEGTK